MALRDFLPRLQFYAARQRQVEAFREAMELLAGACALRSWAEAFEHKAETLERFRALEAFWAYEPAAQAVMKRYAQGVSSDDPAGARRLAERASQDAAAAGALHAEIVCALEQAIRSGEDVELIRHLLDASGDTDAEPLPDTSPGEQRYKLAISHSA
jgi:hypothetical protein